MAAGRTRSGKLHPQGSAPEDAQPGTMRLRKRTAAGAQDAPMATTAGEDEEGGVDFSRKDDDVETLGVKLESEANKRGVKGKNGQITKYITKLGARIKCLLGNGKEDVNTDGIAQLSGLHEAAEEHDHTGLVPFMYRAIKTRRARVEDGAWGQQKADGKVSAGAAREMTSHRRYASLEELAGEVGARCAVEEVPQRRGVFSWIAGR